MYWARLNVSMLKGFSAHLICQSTVFDKLLIIWFSDDLVILLFDPPVGYIIVRVAKAANLKRTPLQKNKKVTVN